MRPQALVQQRLPAIPAPATADILGVTLTLTDYEEMLDWIDQMVASRQRGYLCACNVHTVMASHSDPELHAALESPSAVNVPDGQPLVWAINALGHPLGNRVYGPDLMLLSCARAVVANYRLYLYGGYNQGALVQLALNLRQRYPGIKIVGGYSPPHRPLSEEERQAVADEINGSRADIVWVGTGVPKQEKWMAEMRPRLEAPVLGGVGAAFDFHAGRVPQAPRWMQQSGLEWTYRLTHEPRRLWRRYVRYNPQFVVAFARQLTEQRRAAGDRP